MFRLIYCLKSFVVLVSSWAVFTFISKVRQICFIRPSTKVLCLQSRLVVDETFCV